MDVNSHNAIDLRTTSSFALNRAARKACREGRAGKLFVKSGNTTYEVEIQMGWFGRPMFRKLKPMGGVGLSDRAATASNPEATEKSKRFHLGVFRGLSRLRKAINTVPAANEGTGNINRPSQHPPQPGAVISPKATNSSNASTSPESGMGRTMGSNPSAPGVTPATTGSLSANVQVASGAAVPNGDRDLKILEAVYAKEYGALQQLVEAGVKLGPQDETVSGRCLVTAVLNKDFDILRNLIQLGVNVDAKNEGGHTALMHAAQNGDMRLVRLLVKNGAKIDMKDAEGDNAAQWARNNEHPEIVQYLEGEQRKTRKA
jgi:hypothetical protein